MHGATILLLLAALGGVAAKASTHEDDVVLTSDQANSFMKRWTKRGLYHECYSEWCDFEEVREVLGRTKEAYEYYYTFTCKTFGRNCKVKCEYRKDCSFAAWGSWQGSEKSSAECVTQRRYTPYKYPIETAYVRSNCESESFFTYCPSTPSESRNYCICKKAVCTLGTWSAWTGSISQGKCAAQRRQQIYLVSWTTEAKVGTCADVNKKCKDPEFDIRKRCSCKKAICSPRNWSTWSGSVPRGKCRTQTRTRSFSKTFTYEERPDCKDVQQDCPAPATEKRDFCSCKYATCALGQWSEWDPKALKKGACGQHQTRRKAYRLSLAYQDHVGSCPSLPQKCPDDVIETRQQCMCAYRDSCTVGKWSKWSEDITEVGCKIQTRIKAYLSPLKHAQSDNCKGLNTQCIEEPQETRTFCKCKYVKCKPGDWSEWSDVAPGTCGEQTRTQSYTAKNAFVEKVGGCSDLPAACPDDKQERRPMCKCKTVKCEVGDWGKWQGDILEDTCSTQERKKSVTITKQLQYQEKSCDGLPTTCAAPPSESRKMCNCSYRENCGLKEWGAWNGEVPDEGCAVQIRIREYQKRIKYSVLESCSKLEACPEIRDETRTKCNCNQVICEWTKWFRANYDPKTKCYQEIRVKNISRGLEKLQKFGSCNDVRTSCSGDKDIERRKDCISGGGGHVIVTSPPPTTQRRTPAPTTAFKPATFVSLGCFADNEVVPRPLPLLYKNQRSEIDWHNMQNTVQQCAEEAKKRRFEYFGVQFYGECWGGANAGKTYARDGPSKHCAVGVGMQGANAVYRLEELPACAEELKFEAKVSSGGLTDGAWCAGNENKDQWIEVDLNKVKKITGIGTQGGQKDSWVTTYSIEYSDKGETWLPYKERDETKIFAGNSDRFTLETHWLKLPMHGKLLLFKPQSWISSHACMKVIVYGCDM